MPSTPTSGRATEEEVPHYVFRAGDIVATMWLSPCEVVSIGPPYSLTVRRLAHSTPPLD